ncbi:MAG: CopD family protein [Rhodomicrobium sp.]|nr:CopD family protein [Rhodomicrobium sp.]
MAAGLAFHTLAAVIWVGGMFFAYMILRPSASPLEPAIRLQLWHRVFSRFFPWVWLSITALLVSGFAMVFLSFGGFGAVGTYVHTMMALGIVMVAIYVYLYFVLWQRFRRAVAAAGWTEAAANLGQIRRLVAVNLALGLVTVSIGASGRYVG